MSVDTHRQCKMELAGLVPGGPWGCWGRRMRAVKEGLGFLGVGRRRTSASVFFCILFIPTRFLPGAPGPPIPCFPPACPPSPSRAAPSRASPLCWASVDTWESSLGLWRLLQALTSGGWWRKHPGWEQGASWLEEWTWPGPCCEPQGEGGGRCGC